MLSATEVPGFSPGTPYMPRSLLDPSSLLGFARVTPRPSSVLTPLLLPLSPRSTAHYSALFLESYVIRAALSSSLE